MRIGSTQRSYHRWAAVIAAAAAIGLTACSSEDPPDAAQVDDGLEAGGCAARQGMDTFSAGMSKTGRAGITVQLVGSEPAPPGRFDNTWTLFLEDGSGPLEGAAIEVIPFMPEHGHGTSRTAVVEELGEGVYEADPVNFNMLGVWDTTIEVEAGDVSDSVSFLFCID